VIEALRMVRQALGQALAPALPVPPLSVLIATVAAKLVSWRLLMCIYGATRHTMNFDVNKSVCNAVTIPSPTSVGSSAVQAILLASGRTTTSAPSTHRVGSRSKSWRCRGVWVCAFSELGPLLGVADVH